MDDKPIHEGVQPDGQRYSVSFRIKDQPRRFVTIEQTDEGHDTDTDPHCDRFDVRVCFPLYFHSLSYSALAFLVAVSYVIAFTMSSGEI